VGIRAVHVDFREHRKRDAEIHLAEFRDVGVRAGLLLAELIARKTEHRESSARILFVQRFEPSVLRREAALARGVDDQQHLALEVGQRAGFAVDRLRRKVVDRSHRCL